MGHRQHLDGECAQLELPLWWEDQWRPRYPLATDDFLGGVYRMGRGEATGRRYVEANPQAVSNLLVVDVDHPDAGMRALSSVGNHPLPNVLVENTTNGHAHAVWALAEPVTRTEYARRKPLAYAASVTEGLRRAMDGDKGYSGLLTKNPIHDSWSTEWLHTDLWPLQQLEDELGGHMPPPQWRQQKARRADPVGLGRNCALFDSARHWAYREVRHHWGDPDGLGQAIAAQAAILNHDFSEPLPASEVHAIAASITRWITTCSRIWADGPAVYEATFTTIQAHRGRKGGRKRGEQQSASAAALRQQLREAAAS